MAHIALLSNELKLERFRLALIKSHCENDAEKKKRGIYNRGTIKNVVVRYRPKSKLLVDQFQCVDKLLLLA